MTSPGQTQIEVTSSAGFPVGALPFNIEVDGEIMTVASVSGPGDTVWTLASPTLAGHKAYSPVLYLPAAGTSSAPMLATDNTLTVSPAVGFPTAAPFDILVDGKAMGGNSANGEVMTVTSIQTTASATTTLSLAALATDGTITVASDAGFPTATPFNIVVDGETMTVATVAGTTWTVTRGVDYTPCACNRGDGHLVDGDVYSRSRRPQHNADSPRGRRRRWSSTT